MSDEMIAGLAEAISDAIAPRRHGEPRHPLFVRGDAPLLPYLQEVCP